MRDGSPGKRGLPIISRELQHSAPTVPWCCPHQTSGTAEEAATPQTLHQRWEPCSSLILQNLSPWIAGW